MVVDEQKKLFVAHNLVSPLAAIDGLQFVKGFAREVESLPVDIVVVGRPADGSLLAQSAAMDAVDDPLEDAHVLAEAGPEELALAVFAEPVDVKDAWSSGEIALHAQPVTEVVAHVVAAEGEHGHWIAADLAQGSSGGGGGLAAHGSPDVDPGGPIEGLVDEGDGGGA